MIAQQAVARRHRANVISVVRSGVCEVVRLYDGSESAQIEFCGPPFPDARRRNRKSVFTGSGDFKIRPTSESLTSTGRNIQWSSLKEVLLERTAGETRGRHAPGAQQEQDAESRKLGGCAAPASPWGDDASRVVIFSEFEHIGWVKQTAAAAAPEHSLQHLPATTTATFRTAAPSAAAYHPDQAESQTFRRACGQGWGIRHRSA